MGHAALIAQIFILSRWFNVPTPLPALLLCLTSLPTYTARAIILNNWLANVDGKEERCVEVDLLQEHLNFWIKVLYKAHGSNMSWDWIAMIVPCVNILHRLAIVMNTSLGHWQGTKHSAVDLQNNIWKLMRNHREHGLYTFHEGWTIDDDESQIITDNVTLGLESLTTGTDNPLTEYNASFQQLQRRRQMPPVTTSDDKLTQSPLIPAQTFNSLHGGSTDSPNDPPVLPSSLSQSDPQSTPKNPPTFLSNNVHLVAGSEAANMQWEPGLIDTEVGSNEDNGDGDSSLLTAEEWNSVLKECEGGQGDLTFVKTTEDDIELFSDGEGDDFGNESRESDFEDDIDDVL
uniref:DUF6589 domain-containing protein n=1 Tax=Moniliophthora roreri TaxID=221103 RepID=A0A0W0FXV9_MONRR